MVMGANLYRLGTWTKAVHTRGGGLVCECTAECTLGVRFFPTHIRWRPGVANEKAPKWDQRFCKNPLTPDAVYKQRLEKEHTNFASSKRRF